MGRASKIGSKLYPRLPCKHKRRSDFQHLTGLALLLLKEEISKDPPDTCQQPAPKKNTAGLVVHPHGQYHIISFLSRTNVLMMRLSLRYQKAAMAYGRLSLVTDPDTATR
jgi:hypothetical protein